MKTITDADAERAIEVMLKRIDHYASKPEDTSFEPYKRLIRRAMPEYIRWLATETRNGINHKDALDATCKFAAWMLTNEIRNIQQVDELKGVPQATLVLEVLDRFMTWFAGAMKDAEQVVTIEGGESS